MELRVLLIHGERSRDDLYKSILTVAEPGIQLCVAETLADVRRSPLPELILLDLDPSLPASLEILKWLRAEPSYAGIPVITLTSSQASDVVNRAYELGANSCVMKTENGLLAEIARGIASFARVLKGGYQTA